MQDQRFGQGPKDKAKENILNFFSSDHSGQEPEGLPVAFNDEDGGGDNSNDEMRKNRFKGQKV